MRGFVKLYVQGNNMNNTLPPQGFWTARDLRVISERWNNTGYRDIAVELKRTPASLLAKAQELGLTPKRKRSGSIDTQDIKKLLVSGFTALEISVKLGCTKRRINQIITEDIPAYASLRDAVGKLRRKRDRL